LAVSDHLLTVAGNGPEYATRAHLKSEAENVRDAAQSVVDFCVGKKSSSTPPEPEILTTLKRLAEKVARANSIRASGGAIDAEDWSELNQLQAEAAEVIGKAEATIAQAATAASPAIVAANVETGDYVLVGDESVWLEVGEVSLHIIPGEANNRVEVVAYPNGHEAEEEVARLVAEVDGEAAGEDAPPLPSVNPGRPPGLTA
jgi:hypothetical protein